MNDEQKQEHYELAERLIAEQNFTAAIVAGALATLLAAAAYGVAVAKWAYAYGFAAAGIGIVIGLSMRFPGRGISTKFAVAATVYTIAGCILGSLFRVIVELAAATAASPIDILRNESLSALAGRSVAYFSPVDLVYWFVAVFFAVFLVKRPLSRSERLAIGMFEMKASSTK